MTGTLLERNEGSSSTGIKKGKVTLEKSVCEKIIDIASTADTYQEYR